MADLKARLRTISYPKGTVTAPRGLLEFLFGIEFGRWNKLTVMPALPGHRRKRRFGCRQRSNARAGKVLFVKDNNGDSWTIRVTGTDLDFIEWVSAHGEKIDEIYTARGTIYAKQFPSTVTA